MTFHKSEDTFVLVTPAKDALPINKAIMELVKILPWLPQQNELRADTLSPVRAMNIFIFIPPWVLL